MKIALIADHPFLQREQATLRRLVVGLVNEKTRVMQIVPRRYAGPNEGAALVCPALTFEPSPFAWIRNFRISRLAEAFQQAEPDLIHLFSPDLLPIAVNFAREMDLPLICSYWSGEQVRQMVPAPADIRVRYTVASAPLAECLSPRLANPPELHVLRPGVYAQSNFAPALAAPAESLTALVVGLGVDEHYLAFLNALATVLPTMPQAMFFLHSPAEDQHKIWKIASKLNLLSHISMVPFESVNRELIVQADVLIHPQPLGRVQTLLLDAMAAGRPVLAAADPLIDYLIEGQTARLIPSADPALWSRCLTELVQEPAGFHDLAQSAAQYVRHHHALSTFITACLDTYEHYITPEPLPFTA